jgi:hypothetical protein
MARYILNSNQQGSRSGGHYELHNVSTCGHLPDPDNQLPVGYFETCGPAKAEAKRRYPDKASKIDGCYYCCNPCHTG